MAFGDLCTLADAKAYLQTGQQAFPSTDDALLTRLISAASAAIQSWLKRQLALQDWMEVRDGLSGMFNGPRDARFEFGAFPVTAVSLVVVDTTTIPVVPTAAIAPPGQSTPTTFFSQAGYLFTPSQLIIRGYYVPRKAASVTMIYTAGYAPIPSDVAEACIELVARKYKERSRVAERSRSIGGGETVSYSQVSIGLRDVTSDLQWSLQQHRRVAPVSGNLTQAATQTDPATLAVIGF
jgi:hypothetical protein